LPVYRSGYFNFAKVRSPALSPKVGIDVIGKEKGFGQQQQDEHVAKAITSPLMILMHLLGQGKAL
jgi:hypothetical protein